MSEPRKECYECNYKKCYERATYDSEYCKKNRNYEEGEKINERN